MILQRTNDIDVKIEEGRFIAERIQGAKFIEFEGSDHLFWTGNTQEVLDEMKSFILNVKPKPIYEKQLFTIIVGRLVYSDTNNSKYQELINKHVKQYKGNVVQYNADTFAVTFNGPSKAVLCSIDLVETMRGLNAQLNIGIHIRECFTDHFISKATEDLATSIFKQSKPNQIVLTQTVKNLLIGVNLSFTSYKTIFDTVSGESILLFTVAKKQMPSTQGHSIDHKRLPQNDSFMENVLQIINRHLSNEYFGIDMLCKEMGVSERQLQRKLKAITQNSPNQLISFIRLILAKELILSKDDTISEITFQTGFSNPSYFSKCFKKEFDISPSSLKN